MQEKVNLKYFFAKIRLQFLKRKTNFKEFYQKYAKPYLITQNQIAEEKKEIKDEKRKIKFPSQSKIFLIFLFLNFTALEIFTGYVTVQSLIIANMTGLMPDFTPLVTLLGAVIGETISYGIYSLKAKAENVQGGIVRDLAIRNYEMNQDNDDQGVG